MLWLSFIAVGFGAALGAWARWGLGLLLNPIFPTLPLGTLAANLIGGFIIAGSEYCSRGRSCHESALAAIKCPR